MSRGTETILIAEDDADIRALVTVALCRLDCGGSLALKPSRARTITGSPAGIVPPDVLPRFALLPMVGRDLPSRPTRLRGHARDWVTDDAHR